MRGIIISPAVEANASARSLDFNGGWDDQLVRIWALYFDRMVEAKTRMFWMGAPPELQYLSTLGLFEERTFSVEGDVALAAIAARRECFEDLEGKAPGTWCEATGPNTWQQLTRRTKTWVVLFGFP